MIVLLVLLLFANLTATATGPFRSLFRTESTSFSITGPTTTTTHPSTLTSSPSSTPGAQQVTKTNLTILWLYALDNSEHGWGRVPAGRLAVEDINNSTNGFFNVNYQLVPLERPTQTYGLPDAFNIRKTLGAFVQAVYDYPAQVYLIVGPGFTDEARTLAQLTPIYNLINVAGLATSPSLSDKQAYPLFVRTSQSDGDFKFTIAALMKKFNYTQYIGLYLNNPFALDAASVFQSYLDLHNISVETSVEFTSDNVSLAQVVKRFQKTASRVILLIAKGDKDARTVICTLSREFAVSGRDYVWLFVGFTIPNFPTPQLDDVPSCSAAELDYAINGSFWLDYGGLDANDTRMATGYRPSDLAERVNAYILKNFPNSVNDSISPVSYREYDAFLAVAVALNNSITALQKRSQPPMRIEEFDYSRNDIMRVFKEQLLACNVPGAAGPVQFQPNGDRVATIRVLQYQPNAMPTKVNNTLSSRSSWVQVGWQMGSANGSAKPSELKLTRPLVFGTYNALPPVGVQAQPAAFAASSTTLQIILIAAICGGVLPILLLILFLLRRQHLKTHMRNMHWLIDPHDVTCISTSHTAHDVSPSIKSSPFSSIINLESSAESLHFDDDLNFSPSHANRVPHSAFQLAYYQTTKVCMFPLANLQLHHQRPSLLAMSSVNSNNIWTAVTALGRANKISASSEHSQQQKLIVELKNNRTLITQARLARESTHENVARFIGLLFNALLDGAAAAPEADHARVAARSVHFAVYEWSNKGTLCDLIDAQSVELDLPFKFSILKDVVSGLAYLHHKISFHGRMKSINVLVDKRIVCKLADYGLEKLQSQHLILAADADLLWTAPELLSILFHRLKGDHSSASSLKYAHKVDDTVTSMQRADVFSCATIACELFTRQAPYAAWKNKLKLSHREALEKVALSSSQHHNNKGRRGSNQRGNIIQLLLFQMNADFPAEGELERNLDANWPPPEVYELLTRCTNTDPLQRPTASHVVDTLRRIMRQYHVSDNIMENLLRRLEQYAHNLETLVHDKTQAFFDEKKRAETLLYNILPRSVADQLKQGKSVEPETFESVTIYFSDIVEFTNLSAESTPIQVIDLLNDLYNMFDSILAHYDVYKVETIGDAYMVVSGLPQRNGNEHARQIALMSQQLVRDLNSQFRVRHKPEHRLQLRIGLHSGPCAAGVVGFVMPRYCLFGDTVNTASRMESTGEAMCIHVSQSTQELLAEFFNVVTNQPEFLCVPRGEVPVKGKGLMNTYWLEIAK